MTTPEPITRETVERDAAALGMTPEVYVRVLADALIASLRERAAETTETTETERSVA
jgi:hypothetical protein